KWWSSVHRELPEPPESAAKEHPDAWKLVELASDSCTAVSTTTNLNIEPTSRGVGIAIGAFGARVERRIQRAGEQRPGPGQVDVRRGWRRLGQQRAGSIHQ